MKASIRKAAALAACLFLQAGLQSAVAQDFPSRPVRVALPSQPGASSDVAMRFWLGKLSERTGWVTVADNKPGGNFSIMVNSVLQAPADGHSLLFAIPSLTILPFVSKDLPYSLQRDFVPVTLMAGLPYVLAATPGLPANTLSELVAYSKANPGKLSYGGIGSGSTTHLQGEFIKLAAGLDALHIPYKDTAALNSDLMAGRLGLLITGTPDVLQLIQAGKMRAIATFGGTRYPPLKDVQTAAEATGNPELDMDGWYGLMVRSGTPTAIVERLEREFVAIGRLQESRDFVTKAGLGSFSDLSADALRKRVDADLRRWERVVRDAKLKLN